MATIQEFTKAAETFYRMLNEFASKGNLHLIDLAYPNHDGIADDNVVADIMLLRDCLNAIKNGCEISINDLSRVVDNYNEQES